MLSLILWFQVEPVDVHCSGVCIVEDELGLPPVNGLSHILDRTFPSALPFSPKPFVLSKCSTMV